MYLGKEGSLITTASDSIIGLVSSGNHSGKVGRSAVAMPLEPVGLFRFRDVSIPVSTDLQNIVGSPGRQVEVGSSAVCAVHIRLNHRNEKRTTKGKLW